MTFDLRAVLDSIDQSFARIEHALAIADAFLDWLARGRRNDA
jgi:hypothetical protein